MAKRENCEHRHTTNGNCLFNGGFCLANDEEHCVRINENKSYNQALEDFRQELEKHQQDNWIDNLEYGITFDDVEEVINQLKK